MKFISTKEAPQAIGPYSQAVEANGMIYTSGQIGLTPEGVFAAADVAGLDRCIGCRWSDSERSD
jgi:2-iminobutanoate/2-iminopropanoate deaminase